MINLLELASDNSLGLCTSIFFVVSNKLQVMLLKVQPFDVQVQSVIEKTLKEYDLDPKQIIQTCTGGFEELGIDLKDSLNSYHPIHSIYDQLLKVIDQVLANTRIASSVRKMINSFCSNEDALSLFEGISGFALDSLELSYQMRV